MQSYRFFSIDDAGRVTGERFIICADDDEARGIAEDFITSKFGVEVWDVARQVFGAASAGHST